MNLITFYPTLFITATNSIHPWECDEDFPWPYHRAVFNWVLLNQNQNQTQNNHNEQSLQTNTTQLTNENTKQVHVTGKKRGKTRSQPAIASDQSQEEEKQTKANLDYFRHSIENHSNTNQLSQFGASNYLQHSKCSCTDETFSGWVKRSEWYGCVAM